MRKDSGQSDGDASAMVLFYLFCLAVRERDFLEQKKIREELAVRERDFLEQKKIREELAVRGYSVFRNGDGEFFIQKRLGESDKEEK